MDSTANSDRPEWPAEPPLVRATSAFVVLALAVVVALVAAAVGLTTRSSSSAPGNVGPYIADVNNPRNPINRDTHWHAALGVYDCDHWMGDSSGTGIWNWPAVYTDSGGQAHPGRAGQNEYAGLHSHDDGIIHMEPASAGEAGNNATLGRYFEYGGWKLSADGFSFLGTTVHNGDRCGSGTGTVQWGVQRLTANSTIAVKRGNPASYKLYNDDIVVIAFIPAGASLAQLGLPPSFKNLPDLARS